MMEADTLNKKSWQFVPIAASSASANVYPFFILFSVEFTKSNFAATSKRRVSIVVSAISMDSHQQFNYAITAEPIHTRISSNHNSDNNTAQYQLLGYDDRRSLERINL